MRTAFTAGFETEIPWVLVDVELDEQPELRMIARLADGVVPELEIGARVEVMFTVDGEARSLPDFRLAGSAK